MAKGVAKEAGGKSRRPAAESSAGGFPSPSRLASEQMLQNIHKVLEGRDFKTIEEANAFLGTLTGRGLEKALAEVPPPSPQQEAQELAYRAMDASSNARAIALAKRALAKDPDCVDAIVALATANESSTQGLIAGLERAVAAGQRSLGAEFFRENTGHFWGILETRPYMRARYDLADLLLGEGRVSEAIQHFEALLELNPNDNQGVRDVLLGSYLASDNLEGARRLFRQYKEDGGAVFVWGRVLERVLSGDFAGATRALKHARKENRFVEQYVTGRKKFPREMPDSYSFGSDEEALVCLDSLGEAWANHPEALLWLMGQLHGVFEIDPELMKQARLNF
jgi:tetratricopeptide (TPR) repeat protein